MHFEKLISTIEIHLKKMRPSIDYHNFYIGATSNVKEALCAHHVSIQDDNCIFCLANNITISRDVVQHFQAMGMISDLETIRDNALWVYCYKIGLHTME